MPAFAPRRRGSQAVRQRFAKPLYAGSNPVLASEFAGGLPAPLAFLAKPKKLTPNYRRVSGECLSHSAGTRRPRGFATSGGLVVKVWAWPHRVGRGALVASPHRVGRGALVASPHRVGRGVLVASPHRVGRGVLVASPHRVGLLLRWTVVGLFAERTGVDGVQLAGRS